MTTRVAGAAAVLAVMASMLSPFSGSNAAAHGRFPASGAVVIDPVDANRIAVRSTYGIIVTEDGGEEWRWICAEAASFDADVEDPALVATGDGALLVGSFEGLVRTPDQCSFEKPAVLDGKFVVDLQPGAVNGEVFALTSRGLGADAFEVEAWRSADHGASWAAYGASPVATFLGLTFGVAPSDSSRIYITGRDQTLPVVQRSVDGGMTYAALSLPSTMMGELPYMGGVDPTNPDRVYIGMVTNDKLTAEVIGFRLLATSDAGDTWQETFAVDEAMSGFALSPDGATIAIGGVDQGIWTATRDSLAFAKQSPIATRCLSWVDDGLYACTDPFKSDFALGRSTDGGKSFVGLMELSSPCGPPSCAEGTEVATECPARWPQERAELGAPLTCDDPPSASASGSGGGDDPGSAGCGCRVLAPPRERRGALFALLAGLIFGLRRLKCAHSPKHGR